MAVKRAGALLSDPKLEDEGSSQQTSTRDQEKMMSHVCLSRGSELLNPGIYHFLRNIV